MSITPVPNPVVSVAPSSNDAGTAQRRVRRAVLVRGKVRGPETGRVKIEVRRRVGGHWKRVRVATLRVNTGARFGKLFRDLDTGRYRAHARYLQGSSHREAAVSARRFKIRH